MTSFPIASMETAKVADLIDTNTKQWNHEVIDGVFAQDEAALIKKIPLGRIASEDILFWPYSPDGRYNCKSGYRFLKKEAQLQTAQEPHNQDSMLWKNIWSLIVPNKVKNLLWRACQNATPTKANLVQRTIIEDPLCDRCRAEHETPLHALWECRELNTMWASSGLEHIRRQSSFSDFKDLVASLLRQQTEVGLAAMIMWSI